jgi:hypothetical protein
MELLWRPQSQFCGLSTTLYHYDTVEQLHPATVRQTSAHASGTVLNLPLLKPTFFF